MGLQMIDGYETEQGDWAEEFVFPDPEGKKLPPVKKASKKSANATDLDATDLSAVPLTPEELAALAEEEAAAKSVNATNNATAAANATGSAKSAAGVPVYGPSGAAVARVAVAVLCVLAALL